MDTKIDDILLIFKKLFKTQGKGHILSKKPSKLRQKWQNFSNKTQSSYKKPIAMFQIASFPAPGPWPVLPANFSIGILYQYWGKLQNTEATRFPIAGLSLSKPAS